MCVMCNGPSELSLVQGAPEVALLAAESEQLVEHLETVLEGILQLKPGEGSSLSLLSDSVPVLTLHLFPSYSPRQVTDTDHPLLLNTFAILARHSLRLNALPEVKSAFWIDVLRTKMLMMPTRNVHRSSFASPQFPRFVVDFSHYQTLCDVNEALGDILHTFMTTPATMPIQPQQQASLAPAEVLSTTTPMSTAAVAFGFSFARCKLTLASLEIIERFLNCVFASPDRQYDVDMLNLSDNPMTAAELVIIARIVRKKNVYHFQELKLDKIMPETTSEYYYPPDETPREFLDIMKAAFDVDKLPQLSNSGSSTRLSTTSIDAPSRLRTISMRYNHLCPKYFAAYFSALRYGCPLEEDVSRYIAQYCEDDDDDKEMKKEYWRWLAFGFFYPRPKRFTDAFKLRNLGRLECDRDTAETFMSTMANPVRELVGHGVDNGPYTSMDTLMVCTVKQSASIEVFEYGATTKDKAKWTDTLLERSELEALCEREDGSVCVVVPGIGLGWVQPEFIERIERESLESRWSEQSGWYDVQLGNDESDESLQGLRLMLEVIGRHLRSLSFDYNIGNKCGLVPFFLANCRYLQRLSLEHVNIVPSDGDALIEALSGDLSGCLLALNVNGCRQLSNDFVDKLAAVLANQKNPPVLQELRLHKVGFTSTSEGFAALHQALEANRTLELMELTGSRIPRGFEPKDVKLERDRLEASYQGQLLVTRVPMRTKLAFLSVVGTKKKTRDSDRETTQAIHSLDSWLLSTIFALAASPKVRRKIAWNSDINQKHYAEEE